MIKQMIKDDSALGQMTDVVCLYANIILEQMAKTVKRAK
jgi:hypothetical protein